MNKDKLLSYIILAFGVILLGSGITYYLIRPPEGMKGIISGIVIIGVGVVLQIISRRKQAREKEQNQAS